MSLKLDVEQHGVREATADLLELGIRASDVRAVSLKIGRIVSESTKRRFQSRGSGSWPPLAESTKERKARDGLDPRPMRATGALYASLTKPQPTTALPDELHYGTDLPYSRFGHYGTVNEPTRRLVELRPSERRQVEEVLTYYISRGER